MRDELSHEYLILAMTIRFISVNFLNLAVTFNCRNWIFYYLKIGDNIPQSKLEMQESAAKSKNIQIVLHLWVIFMIAMTIALMTV